MIELHLGDELTYLRSAFRIIGVTPMSTNPRRIYLEEISSGQCTEADLDEIQREALITAQSPSASANKG